MLRPLWSRCWYENPTVYFSFVLSIFHFLWEHIVLMIDISKWYLLQPFMEVNCSFLEPTTPGLPLQSIWILFILNDDPKKPVLSIMSQSQFLCWGHTQKCVPHSVLSDWRDLEMALWGLAMSEQKAKPYGPRNLVLLSSEEDRWQDQGFSARINRAFLICPRVSMPPGFQIRAKSRHASRRGTRRLP